MVLSGTLREFILADVMQLLTQQKITGRLVINSGSSEGTILFKNGMVIGATRQTESFTNRLFFYLVNVLHHPRNKVRELFTTYEGKTAQLTTTLESKGFVDHNELENYANNVVLDIACSLFLWTSGKYHFDIIPNVDNLIPADICLPVENIVMEAMRRIDEWKRMKEAISEDVIFVQTDEIPEFEEGTSLLNDPIQYCYKQIDGTSPVRTLLENSYLTEYKLYECLYILMESQQIEVLKDSLMQSVQAALNKSETTKKGVPIQPILITAVIIIVVLLVSLLLKNVLFRDLHIKSELIRSELPISRSEQNVRMQLHYLEQQSLHSTATEQREFAKHLSNRDIATLNKKKRLQSQLP